MAPPARDLVIAADRVARGLGRTGVGRVASRLPHRRSDPAALRAQIIATRPRLEQFLVENLLPRWFSPDALSAQDGRPPADLSLLPDSNTRVTIGTARYAWFLAALARSPWGRPEHLAAAVREVGHLREQLWDPEHGGFFFRVDASGRPVVDRKETYTHAFALKALSEVADATDDASTAAFADEVFAILRTHLHDERHRGFRELVGRDWLPLTGPQAGGHVTNPDERRLDTLLHLTDAMETYVSRLDTPAARSTLAELTTLLAVDTVDERRGVGGDAFTTDWTPDPDLGWWRTAVSYGHESERVTVLDRAARTLRLDQAPVNERLRRITLGQLRWGLDRLRGGVFHNGAPDGPAWDTTKVGWVQAESLHAYLLVYRLTGDAQTGCAYLRTLDWIDRHQIDWTRGGWHERIGRWGRTLSVTGRDWNTPYHEGRALLYSLDLLHELDPASRESTADRAPRAHYRDAVTELAERLGYGGDERLLIINCDDLGLCQAANVGVFDSLRGGLGTSATLMVPCPWAREASAHYLGEDVGVHLTLNAEFDLYRWGPITQAPSLLDGDGGFPRTITDVWDHADLDEVRRECRAQIERAILWGFDVSHLDSHMGALQLKPEFFDVYLELAIDFGLPLRLSGSSTERTVGFPFRRLASEEGVVFPDNFVLVPNGVGSRRAIEKTIFELRPGVTEMYVHPAADTPELRALAPDWANRVDDHHLITLDTGLRTMVERSGVTLIGFRQLRELQRAG